MFALMERHSLSHNKFTYCAMINLHKLNGDPEAAEVCYHEAAAAGELDHYVVSQMLSVYESFEMVRAL